MWKPTSPIPLRMRKKLSNLPKNHNAETNNFCRSRAELIDFDAEEAQEYLESLGRRPGVSVLIRSTYKLLGLAFTNGEKEVRAWTFKINESTNVG